ncbi:hypothetical protein EDD80_11722 [Anseongella ginsenosidimutans]|uniref:Transcriptional regulator n=1 Tax=Anseongella ginsenosidimutans TaxID=496056 RepID=A0A4V2UT92_9SPHI|nr:ArsR family transcriptional regulator [Anseongella ginsenosidimutans]QEC52127.1 ArsR family transcriptional regulator [Anseongella ginsenosidimutans]TCS84844.1 hypothetical protein EDD80_11722 [Anseongella ginsenosidimutans]
MLDALISSKTRIKLLLRLFLNPENTAYLRGLADEFGESTNSVRVELNRFEKAEMVTSANSGNKKMYRANTSHPLYRELQSILLKYIGIDRVIESVTERLGDLEKVYLAGDYASGKDSGVIDLVFIGNIDKVYLLRLVEKAEAITGRKVRFLTYETREWAKQPLPLVTDFLLLWENGRRVRTA